MFCINKDHLVFLFNNYVLILITCQVCEIGSKKQTSIRGNNFMYCKRKQANAK